MQKDLLIGVAKILAIKPAAIVAAMTALAITFSPTAASAQNGVDSVVETIALGRASAPYTGEATVPAGKSLILKFDQPIREVLVGDPAVADIIPLTDRSVYILGKKNGGTNLTVFGSSKRLLGVIDLQVSYDLLNLKKRLHDLMPNERIEVRSNGESILLSGQVTDSGVSNRARLLAENYAPDNVVNLIDISAPQQVMLAVRFAEVERNAAKELGISTDAIFNGAKTGGSLQTAFVNADSIRSSFARALGNFSIGAVDIDLVLDALENRGVASILAEPTLMALSGETASFLAGGEFPVPVGSSDADGSDRSSIRVEFKEFGVRLSFTPTVLGETVSLNVESEVSELDPASGIQLDNIVIPGLKTRRARTTVELKNGQSFAIAGLIQKEFIDELDQMPGLSATPILGALMRSARFRREDTELTIIITPYLVEPSDLNTLMSATDSFVRPHELELFFLGQVEGDQPFDFVPRKNIMQGSSQESVYSRSGVDGAVGYVVK